MNLKTIYAVYFSPTHGTKAYVEGIAARLAETYETIDLTRPELRSREYFFGPDDLVILGAPVYAGRLPALEGGIFERLHGDRTPAVFNVTYGNREYDDALLEEKNLCEKNGFAGIAAAWIAPHSFSSAIAAGRPDAQDEKHLDTFAEQVKAILSSGRQGRSLSVKGNEPYKDGMAMSFHPAGNDRCTDCCTCVSACPTGAIVPANPRETDTEKCIDCLACVRVCPSHARGIFHPMFQRMVGKLESNLIPIRKEPEFFL